MARGSRYVHREQTFQIARNKLVVVDNGIPNQTGRSFAIAYRQHRMGIDQTGWFRTDPEFYDSCLQATDYKPVPGASRTAASAMASGIARDSLWADLRIDRSGG